MTPRVLIADSDPQYCRWLSLHVQSVWPDAAPECRTPGELLASLTTLDVEGFDILLLGTVFKALPQERSEGYEWLRRLRKQAPSLPVIALATGGSELAAVKALRLGARDYLPRATLDRSLLARCIRRTVRQSAMRRARKAKAHLAGSRTTRLNRSNTSVAPTLTAATPQIPGYAPLHQIGDSTRAMVWLAHSAALGRNVALKVSKPPTGTDDDFSQSFAREYAALSALRHPGVVEIYAYGTHSDCEFLAMEYFPCGDLKQRLQQPITPVQSLEYLGRIATALKPVHDAGLMHRDLKPPNIMLRADCSVVLIDFGLAKRQNAETAITSMGVRRGSPYYMSPEQVQGLPLDSRSDLYSLGVIFYEMLTGRKPYTGTSAIELMELHVNGVRPPLPEELAQYEPLLAAMMTIEREERVANASALLQLLRDYQPEHLDLATLERAHAG